MRRKGEFSTGQFHREYPFQAAFPHEHSRDLYRGSGFYPSHAPRTSTRVLDGHLYVLIGLPMKPTC